MDVTRRFPAQWLDTVHVRRVERDGMGKIVTEFHHEIPDCLFAPEGSFLPDEITTIPRTKRMVLGPPMADLRSGDELTIPASSWHPKVVASVDGEPGFWPLGTVVALKDDDQ